MTFSLTLFHCEKVSCLSLMSVQSLSCVWLFATPWTAAHQASLSIIKSWSLLGDVIQPSYLLSSLSPPVPFSIFPASGSFPMSQFFASGGQSIGVLASILVLPMNIQDWFPLGWTGWLSLQSKGLARVFSNKAECRRIDAFKLWCWRRLLRVPWIARR